MIHDTVDIRTAIAVVWSDKISLNGRVCANAAAVTRLATDVRFTEAERAQLEQAAKLLFSVLVTVAIRGV
jgi:hypothetical protein